MILKRHAHAYGSLSSADKRALALERAREPPVTCPACGTRTDASDLQVHIESRCQGPQDPGPHWRWVDKRAAVKMGVPQTTLSFWARIGHVRYIGQKMDRKYLLRDLSLKIAQRKGFRRR